MNKTEFLALIEASFKKEALKKLIFSRPKSSEISKISCRLVAHRGRRLLAMEFSLPGNTVSHRNLGEEELCKELLPFIDGYKQINLITTLGDAELKCSKSGKETVIGGENLKRRLSGDAPAFESAIESIDKKKNYISQRITFLKGKSNEKNRGFNVCFVDVGWVWYWRYKYDLCPSGYWGSR